MLKNSLSTKNRRDLANFTSKSTRITDTGIQKIGYRLLPALLKCQRVGYCILSLFIGCVLYADDILLLSPSVIGLQNMLDRPKSELASM